MRSMALASLLVASLAASSSAQGGCPFSGIATSSFGTGGGSLQLSAEWDASNCALQFTLSTPSAPSPGVAFHHILFGLQPLASPFLLPTPPFLPDCAIDILPLDSFGPFFSEKSSLVVPPDPALIGLSFYFEAIPTYYSITLPPMPPSLGDSTALKLQLN